MLITASVDSDVKCEWCDWCGDVLQEILDLGNVMERQVGDLSGGELQRFAIAIVCIQNANIYMFDEPSSYLDVKQRLNASKAIRSMVSSTSYE